MPEEENDEDGSGEIIMSLVAGTCRDKIINRKLL